MVSYVRIQSTFGVVDTITGTEEIVSNILRQVIQELCTSGLDKKELEVSNNI